MTYEYVTTSLKRGFVHDVITVTHTGTHTYEFIVIQDAKPQKMRVTDVISLDCHVRCSCHHQ